MHPRAKSPNHQVSLTAQERNARCHCANPLGMVRHHRADVLQARLWPRYSSGNALLANLEKPRLGSRSQICSHDDRDLDYTYTNAEKHYVQTCKRRIGAAQLPRIFHSIFKKLQHRLKDIHNRLALTFCLQNHFIFTHCGSTMVKCKKMPYLKIIAVAMAPNQSWQDPNPARVAPCEGKQTIWAMGGRAVLDQRIESLCARRSSYTTSSKPKFLQSRKVWVVKAGTFTHCFMYVRVNCAFCACMSYMHPCMHG